MTHVFVWTLEGIFGVVILTFIALYILLLWVQTLYASWKKRNQSKVRK